MPITETLQHEILSLPMGPHLTMKNVSEMRSSRIEEKRPLAAITHSQDSKDAAKL